jgi:putative transposase
MAKGFVYLTAVVDWASRRVLAAKVAITLEACHAVDVLQEAFSRHGKPEIVNTDQGRQFTAHEFVQGVKEQGCKLSMDGRGAWKDNVFVERLWKSVKYERVYLHAYDSVTEARTSVMQYINWYNRSRPHIGLKYTPNPSDTLEEGDSNIPLLELITIKLLIISRLKTENQTMYCPCKDCV